MSYTAKVISRDERILHIFRPHWIYLLEGLAWMIFITGIGIILDSYTQTYPSVELGVYKIDFETLFLNGAIPPLTATFGLAGAFLFLNIFLIHISTEIGLTDQRIIYKKGVLLTQIDQVDLQNIRAEYVYHGLLGWLLGYGRIHLDCSFIDDVWLPAIHKPYQLIRASHHARMIHDDIEYGENELVKNVAHINRTEQKNLKVRKKMAQLKHAIQSSFRRAA